MEIDGWKQVASLYDGPRAVGGQIVVDGGRLKFEPHAFDRALAGKSIDVPLTSVERITLTSRSWLAPRRHVLVETTEDVRARFLVNGAKALIEDLAEAVKRAGGTPTVSA